MEKQYRLLRILEYVGTREFIDDCIRQRGIKGMAPSNWNRQKGRITEAFIGELPEELQPFELNGKETPDGNTSKNDITNFIVGVPSFLRP